MEDKFIQIKSQLQSDNDDGEFTLPPLLVGVAGGSASGKSTLCLNIINELKGENSSFTVISLDSYYKGLENIEMTKDYNFDHPDALDWDLAYENLQSLLKRKVTEIPQYSFVTHNRLSENETKYPADIILVEGILALYDERIRNLLNYKIFVHCDNDIRLCRRIIRDVEERGREVEGILYQYNVFVKNSFDEFVQPTMNYADIVVPSSKPNQVAIRFIAQNLKNMMKEFTNIKNYLNEKLIINFYDLYCFFQDLQYQKNNSTNYEDDQYESIQKVFAYEIDKVNRLTFSQQYLPLLQQSFNYSFYWEVNKLQIKRMIYLFDQHVKLNNLSKSQIEILDINQLKINPQDDKSSKYAIIYQEWISIENYDEFHLKLEYLSQRYKQIFIINLFIHMKRMARLLQEDQQSLIKDKFLIFNAFVMINFKKIHNLLQQNCRDKQLSICLGNNYDDIFNKRIKKILLQ